MTSIYEKMTIEKMDEYFLLSAAVTEIFRTIPNAKGYKTPLGIFFEIEEGKGFYLSDINTYRMESRITSFRLYGDRDKCLLLRRVFMIDNLSSLSKLLDNKELNITEIKEYFNEYI